MKNLLKIVLLIITFQATAQTIIPLEQESNYMSDQAGKNYYYKDVNGVLNKFIGTWKYQNTATNPTEEVTIVFYKEIKDDYNGNYFIDRLYARSKYVKNGVVVFDNLTSTKPSSNYQIFGGFFRDPANTNKIHMQYGEPGISSNKRHSTLDITYSIVKAGTKLKWSVDWYPLDENVPAPLMPLDMTLTKVN